MEFQAILLPVELRHLAVLIALVGTAFAACTRVEAAKSSPNVPLGDGGFGGEPGGGSGSLAGAGGDGGHGELLSSGGAPGAIEVGLWPTFAADPDQTPNVQAVLASVSALSLGATTLPLAERWDQLSGATGSPRAVTWSRLDAMTEPYRDRDGGVALCIGIVDREVLAWPDGVDLASDAASSAIERTIDEVYARYATHLSHLCFGYQVDRYLAVASSMSQKRLLAFLKHAVDYASQHPLRAAKTAIGTAITLDALASGSRAPLDQLMLGDEVVAVYDPLDAKAVLKAPESVAGEVTAALETLAAAPGALLPLALFEVGYPSSEAAGSSEKAQKKYYDTLFDVLDSKRQDVSFVGAFGLDDRVAADCEAEALSFGGTPAAKAQRALVRCSMGLRAETTGDPRVVESKLAWPSVVAAVSRYR
jgi:hypothetical protein